MGEIKFILGLLINTILDLWYNKYDFNIIYFILFIITLLYSKIFSLIYIELSYLF